MPLARHGSQHDRGDAHVQNHYPERLHEAIVWHPPSLFQVLWKGVSPFVDMHTRKRITFCMPTDKGAHAVLAARCVRLLLFSYHVVSAYHFDDSSPLDAKQLSIAAVADSLQQVHGLHGSRVIGSKVQAQRID